MADAQLGRARMFDNSFSVGLSDDSTLLKWDPEFCTWPLVNSLTTCASDYDGGEIILSLSVYVLSPLVLIAMKTPPIFSHCFFLIIFFVY
jgi:hypothetical protein